MRFDLRLFHFINSDLANPFFDLLMPLVRNPFIWAPLYIFFAAFFIFNFRSRGLLIIAFSLLAFALSDQLSAHLIKFLVQRPRPCNDPAVLEHVRLLIPCGAGFSFPSSHATNHFTLSFFLIILLQKARKGFPYLAALLILWAALVSFAQVYVGIHYPSDIAGGAILGILIGIIMGRLCKASLKKTSPKAG